ncbi:MAG: porin family protein [Methylacidiphilales bacterium]|nr:porin family protein [Candidatus Methylacidiphilales bacterium]
MNGSKTGLLAAGVWALTSSVAFAADMPLLEHAPVIEDFGGWYLRGDIGMTNQQTDRIHNVTMDPANAPGFEFLDSGSFDSGWLFGLGIGYQFNSWLRADLTGEYRGKTSFRALDRYDEQPDGVWDGENEYTATKSEWLFLANAYVDLGTWYGIIPFVGAGIGVADVTIGSYRDANTRLTAPFTDQIAYAGEHSQWNLAWALHAGLAYHFSPALTVEFAYRYLSLGDGKSGDVIAGGGANNFNNPTTFHDLTSHDVKVALRWALGGQEVVPVVRKY